MGVKQGLIESLGNEGLMLLMSKNCLLGVYKNLTYFALS